MSWYQVCFDRNWIVCTHCGVECLKVPNEKKRKCPVCKMNNQNLLPTINVQRKGKGVSVNGQYLSPKTVDEAAQIVGIKLMDKVEVSGAARWKDLNRTTVTVSIPLSAGNSENRHQPMKQDLQKNIDGLQRAVDGKPRGTDFVSYLDTLSILKAIQRALPGV